MKKKIKEKKPKVIVGEGDEFSNVKMKEK